MPEAELARVDECDRSIPRRETIRGTHWQKTPFGCLDLASRNPSWQRSCATATTDRTYDRKRSDSHEQTLATRGPSTYGSGHVRPRQQTGHMIASDRIHTNKLLQPGGRPHMAAVMCDRDNRPDI